MKNTVTCKEAVETSKKVGARVFWRPDVSNVESWQHADEHTAEILSERD